MTIYRIKDTVTGLYSRGGVWPTFSKTGKVWKNKGSLSSHLILVMEGCEADRYKNCFIEAYELTETPLDYFSIQSYYDPVKERRAEKQRKRELAWQEAKVQREVRELERLKNKYPS